MVTLRNTRLVGWFIAQLSITLYSPPPKYSIIMLHITMLHMDEWDGLQRVPIYYSHPSIVSFYRLMYY